MGIPLTQNQYIPRIRAGTISSVQTLLTFKVARGLSCSAHRHVARSEGRLYRLVASRFGDNCDIALLLSPRRHRHLLKLPKPCCYTLSSCRNTRRDKVITLLQIRCLYLPWYLIPQTMSPAAFIAMLRKSCITSQDTRALSHIRMHLLNSRHLRAPLPLLNLVWAIRDFLNPLRCLLHLSIRLLQPKSRCMGHCPHHRH